MLPQISEIQIVPIRPKDGIVAFASLLLDGWLYLGSVAIMTRPQGGYRLLYPTKKLADRNIPIYHPIRREIAQHIEQKVIEQLEDVMNQHDRYDCAGAPS